MSRAALDAVLKAAADITVVHPAVREFAAFPDAPAWADLHAQDMPALPLVRDWAAEGDDPEARLHRAISAAAPHAQWRQTYTPEEVGDHFLANYGYFELYGPKGHYRAEAHCGFVSYWNAGLEYDWHHHEAEELYLVVSGEAVFRVEGREDLVLKRGDTSFHAENQKHALVTLDSPVLTYVVWRGKALSELPRMAREHAGLHFDDNSSMGDVAASRQGADNPLDPVTPGAAQPDGAGR